jgi:putative iron-dependent peroxidase
VVVDGDGDVSAAHLSQWSSLRAGRPGGDEFGDTLGLGLRVSVSSQPWVLAALPGVGRFLVFDVVVDADPKPSLERLWDAFSPERGVVGIGTPLAAALGRRVPGLRPFPALAGPACAFPATQGAMWAFVAGQRESEVQDASASLAETLGDSFVLREEVAVFKYREGRDLTGYLDGTANPVGEAAVETAIVAGAGPGLDGSTFVSVQRYVHDLVRFRRLAPGARDEVIGRRVSDNEEIADAPESAHVKRTEQESFEPSGFMLRRSMPWGGVGQSGLYFVAYGESLDRFERTLRRMAGLDDGRVDSLLRYTRALSGGYYWCPPLARERLDLSALGL